MLQTKTSFAYDAQGGRVAKLYDGNGDGDTVDAGDRVERVTLDGGRTAVVFDGSQAVVNRYLHGPSADEVLAEEIPSATGSDKLHWTLTDGQGSVRDTANAAGAFAAHTTLSSFGKPATSVVSRFAYTGQEYDTQTNLSYMNARYYDATLGKFVGQDPAGFGAGDSNLYRYVGNNATNLTDPTGLTSVGDAIHETDTFQQAAHRQMGMRLHGPKRSGLAKFADNVLGIDDGHAFGLNTHTWLGAITDIAVTAARSPEMAWNWDDYWDHMDAAVIRSATDPQAASGTRARSAWTSAGGTSVSATTAIKVTFPPGMGPSITRKVW